MTKRLFDQAQLGDARRAARARGASCRRRRRRPRTSREGVDRVPREAPAAASPVVETSETVDYHTGGEPFRIVTGGVEPLPGRDDPRQAPLRARAPRRRPPAARPRAARPRRHVRLLRHRAGGRRAPTSASSSSTTRATRPPAATGRSRSSPGRSRAGLPRRRAGDAGRRRRAVGAARDRARVEGGDVALGALPQRARRSSHSPGTSASAARSTPASRSASSRPSCRG